MERTEGQKFDEQVRKGRFPAYSRGEHPRTNEQDTVVGTGALRSKT